MGCNPWTMLWATVTMWKITTSSVAPWNQRRGMQSKAIVTCQWGNNSLMTSKIRRIYSWYRRSLLGLKTTHASLTRSIWSIQSSKASKSSFLKLLNTWMQESLKLMQSTMHFSIQSWTKISRRRQHLANLVWDKLTISQTNMSSNLQCLLKRSTQKVQLKQSSTTIGLISRSSSMTVKRAMIWCSPWHRTPTSASTSTRVSRWSSTICGNNGIGAISASTSSPMFSSSSFSRSTLASWCPTKITFLI